MTLARLRPLPLLLMLAALTAAEEAPPTISLSLTDPGRSLDRLAAGLYGQAWARPAVAPLRQALQQRSQPVLEAIGQDDLATAIRAVEGLRFDATAYDGDWDESALALFITGDGIVGALYRVLGQMGQPTAVAGATEAATMRDTTVALFPEGLGLGFDGHPPGVLPVAAGEDDLVGRFDWSVLGESLTGRGAPAGLAAEMTARLPEAWHLRLVPEGIDQHLAFAAIPQGLAPVDRALLDRVPADSAMVMAIGFDAEAWWRETDRLLTQAAAASTEAEEGIARMREQIAAVLTMLGLEGGAEELVAGWQGTMLTHVAFDTGLVPALTIALPRSPAIDTVVAGALGLIGQEAPGAGELRFLSIPLGQRELQNLVPGVVVARDASHWLVGTDALLVSDWIAGATGGWLERAESRLAEVDLATTQVLGWSDTPALLRSAMLLVGTGASQLRQPRLAEAALEFSLGLAREAQADLVVGAPVDGEWRLRGQGPLGGASLVLVPNLATSGVILGVTLPAVNMARQQARRAQSMNHMKQILMAGFAYQNDHDMQWPPTLAALREQFGDELPAELFRSPGGEDVPEPHYLYVRPAVNAKSMQPVLVENPALGHRGLLVGFADGHVATYHGEMADRIWQRAQELAQEAETNDWPIPPDRWAELMNEL